MTGGNPFAPQAANVGQVNAMIYGGRQPDGMGGFTNQADVLIVGSDPGQGNRRPTAANTHPLWIRQAGAGLGANLTAVGSFTIAAGGTAVRDVAVDPNDWRTIFILDARGRIWQTFDGAVADPDTWTWTRMDIGNPIVWDELGPGPIQEAQFNAPPDNAGAGAVEAIAVHPTDPNTVFLGTVAGGVWRTNDFNSAQPDWVPLSDRLESLYVGSLVFDPNDADTLYVGTGSYSNTFRNRPSQAAVGLYRTTNANEANPLNVRWENLGRSTFQGLDIRRVLPSTNPLIILVAAADSNGNGGLFRSADDGQSWADMTDGGDPVLPAAVATDVMVDPNDPNRISAAIPGNGVYMSTDTGATWARIDNQGTAITGVGVSTNIELAAHDAGATTVLYVGVIDDNGQLSGVFRDTQGGDGVDNDAANGIDDAAEYTWTAIGPAPPATHGGGQGFNNFAIVADPTNANMVYVSGDRPPNIFRGEAGANTWTSIVLAGTSSDTNPHADSRHMVFLNTTTLLESDDGGVFQLPTPLNAASSDWVNKNGNLRDVEFHDVAFDTGDDLAIGGAQDNGSEVQNATGSQVWTRFLGGDGSSQAYSIPGDTRYSLGNNFTNFVRNGTDQLLLRATGSGVDFSGLESTSPDVPDSAFEGSRFESLIPVEPNRFTAGGLLIARRALYESSDSGDTITQVALPGKSDTDVIRKLVYGGVRAGTNEPNIFWAGTNSGRLYIRDQAGTVTDRTAALAAVIPGSSPGVHIIKGIAVDPQDWHRAWVIKGNQVAMTTDAGATWTEVTFNLPAETAELRDAAFVDISPLAGDGIPVVSGWGGVFLLNNNTWSKYGQTLPNVLIHDIDFHDHDIDGNAANGTGMLLVGTFGRGAWVSPNTSTSVLSALTNHLASLPGATSFQRIEVDNVGGSIVLLAAGEGGVFRKIGSGPWTEYGVGLPNVLTTAIERYPTPDDILLAGTLGRGAWTIPNAGQTIGVPGTIVIDGADQAEVFKLVRNADEPWLLDVFVNLASDMLIGDPKAQLPFASIESITINGNGGEDTLTVDISNGAVAVPAGITFNGADASDTVEIVNPGAATVTSDSGIVSGGLTTTARQTVTVVDAFGDSGTMTVRWTGVETGTDGVTVAQNVDVLAPGLGAVAAAFQSGLSDALRGMSLAGVNAESIASALNGILVDEIRPKDLPFLTASSVRPQGGRIQLDDVVSVLNRIFSQGGLDLGQVSTSGALATPAALRQALDDLDAIPGNVTLDEVTDRDDDGSPDIFFEMTVSGTELEGIIDLDVRADVLGGTGRIELSGALEITATIDLNVDFGVDSQGFFIVPTDPAETALKVTNLVISGDVAGSGRLGFLGVDVSGATLSLDPQVEISIGLTDPGTLAADGTIRVPELTPDDFRDLISAEATGDPADGLDDDVVLTGTFGVSLLLPGFDDDIDLVDADLTVTWPDAQEVEQVIISASTGAGQALLDFLQVGFQEVLDQLIAFKDQLDVLDADIPFIEKGLEEIIALIQVFQDKVIEPLTQPGSFTVRVPTIQEMALQLIASLGIDLEEFGLSYSTSTDELTYRLQLDAGASTTDTLGFDFDLADGLADVNFSTDAGVSAGVLLDVIVGVDIGGIIDGDDPLDWFFLRDPSLSGNLSLTASNVDASARFGFLSIGIVDGSVAANPSLTLSLNDTGTTAADGRLDLRELIDGVGDLETLLDVELTGGATLSLPISAPFIGLTPGPDTTLIVTIGDFDDLETYSVSLPPALSDLGNFTNMNAGTLVGLLAQVTGWLDDFRRSDTFANFDVPFVGPALDEILGFADEFRDTLLFDDADDGNADAETLIYDVNQALETAELDDRIRAEADGARIRLIAVDTTVTEFSITAPGGNALGFDTSQTAVTDIITLSLTGISDAPADGVLIADVTFNVTVNGGTPVPVTVLAADTTENTSLGNDVAKLVDVNGSPTFATAQQLALKAAEILGVPSDVVEYDAAEDILTFTLDLSGTFGTLELPLDFNLDLSPLLALETDTLVELSASGGLTLTLGVFMGDAPASTILEGSKLLSEIGDGVDIQTNLAITAPNPVSSFIGRLSADARFALSIDGGAGVDVTVLRDSTESNTTLDDLVADVNTALATAGLAAQIEAQKGQAADNEDGRIVLVVLDGGITAVTMTADATDPTVREMGFVISQDAADDGGTLKIKASQDVLGRLGQLSADASFDVILNTVNGGSPVPVTLPKTSTFSHRNILEVVNALQAVIDDVPELDGKVTVMSRGLTLIFKATEAGATTFNIIAAGGNPAVTELGLGTNNIGNSAEFVITTRDGAKSAINLNGLTTLQDVINAINAQSAGKVTAAINENGTGLQLTDNTAGGADFIVNATNGTQAAINLGILARDAGETEEPDGVIDGGTIGGLTAQDRFFISDASATVGISLATPGGISASAMFGFVEVALSGSSSFDADLTLGLQDPGTVADDGRITLAELIDALSDITSLIAAPDLNGTGGLTLDIDVSPSIPGINVPDDAQIVITINDIGNPFTDPVEAPDITFSFPDLGDLLAFDNIEFNFDSILDALLALADFLGQFEAFDFLNQPIPLINVSVNDLLTFVDEFRDALNAARNDPAGSLQVLEAKLKEAFGLSLVTSGGAEILRLDIEWDAGFNKSMPLNLDLGLPDFANLSGNAGLTAAGDIDVHLAFGIDLSNPLNFYIFDATGITGSITLAGDDIEFQAALGPLGIFVRDDEDEGGSYANLSADLSLGLQDLLDGEIFGVSLPLVGDQLSSGARFIEDFRKDFIDPLREEVSNLTDPDSNFISTKLFELLGPGGLNILLDSDDPGTDITAADVVLDTNLGTPGIDTDEVYIQWNVLLGGDLLDIGTGIGFDIGFPGLGLETTGEIDLNINWELALGFGLDFVQGFYLDVSDANELEVEVNVTLPGAGITGRLAILQIEAFDNGGTHLTAQFALDVHNRNNPADTKLGLGELPSIGFNIGFAAEAIVDLGMELQLNSELVPGADTVFPKIVADFYLLWGFGDVHSGTLVSIENMGSALADGLQIVEFRNVGLDLGTFISDVIGPIVKEVQKATEPLQPIIDAITAPIPLLSDLAGSPITLLDLAEIFAGDYFDVRMIRAIADLINLINAIPADAESVIITFGDFELYNAAGGLTLDLSNPAFDLSDPVSSGFETPTLEGFDFDGLLAGQPSNGTTSFTNNIRDQDFGGGFSFPILDDPSQIFGLLMGRPATLIAYDLPPLLFTFDWSQFFSIFGPLGVSINVNIGINIDFAFAYDTLGIQRFAEGGFRNPLTLFDGFFISDTASPTGEGEDVSEITFTGLITAAAELNLGVAKAGVAGGAEIIIRFDLHDPNEDGKIRLIELAKNFLNEFNYGSPLLAPLAIFDVTGEAFFRLFAFLKVDLFILTIDKEFDITPPLKLLDFEIPFTRVPTLANELSGGALQLNAGPNAKDRLEGDDSDIAETFDVDQGSSPNKVDVTAFGYTQTYSINSPIIALGGDGDDVFDFSDITNPAITYEIEGGGGNDTIILPANAGRAVIDAGPGDDTIVSGAGNDVIIGGAGNDTIDAGGGNDIVFADTGEITDDAYKAPARLTDGNDIVNGGDGNDLLVGSGGDDQVNGDGGEDIVIGDGVILGLGSTDPEAFDTAGVGEFSDTSRGLGGNDLLTGGLGNDIIYAGKGDDDIDGGDDDDDIFAEDGADTVGGGAGNDLILGSRGKDVIDGNDGDDEIYGDEDADTIHGNAGLDEIHGGIGPDEIWGDEDNDTINGGPDPDKIYGGGGSDDIDGGAGSNVVWGDDKPGDATGAGAADTIVTGPGPDEIHGQEGGDDIDGGDGDNRIFGDDGDDDIVAGLGNHIVTGGAGNDVIILGDGILIPLAPLTDRVGSEVFGDDGNDEITIGLGNHIIVGDAGDDTIVAGDAIPVPGAPVSVRIGSEVTGDAGVDDILIGTGNHIIDLGTEDDTLVAGSGVVAAGAPRVGSEVFGRTGVDLITLGDGNHLVRTHEGNDTVIAGIGDSDVAGGGGADIIILAGGDNLVYGGDNPFDLPAASTGVDEGDTITTGPGDDEINSQAGGDVIDAGAGDDMIFTDEGDDTVTAGLGSDVVGTADGADTVYAGTGPAGDPGETASVNEINLGLGDDEAYGDFGADIIIAGDGDDDIFALPGDDFVQGNLHDDLIMGGPGNDVLIGGRGDDRIDAGAGNDVIWGGFEDVDSALVDPNIPANFENPIGFDPAELLIPTGYVPPLVSPVVALGLSMGSDSDDLPATADEMGNPQDFNDFLIGGPGNDVMFGGGGRDKMFGGSGNDYVDGGGGTDFIFPDAGSFGIHGRTDVDPQGRLTADALFSLRIDGGPPVPISITAALTAGNPDVDALAGQINAALLAQGVTEVFARRLGSLRLGLVLDTDLADSLEISSANTAANDELGLFAGGTEAGAIQAGQRAWGGDGIDFLYAFSNTFITDDPADIALAVDRIGDELHGGSGNDQLYGNLGRDAIFGDSGNETIFGDALAGPTLAENIQGHVTGGNDYINGGTGQDIIKGGGGDDELWRHADGDYLVGQKGNDTLYGGHGIDFMELDTHRDFFDDGAPAPIDIFDGHFGNTFESDTPDENSTDIMIIVGTNQDDVIRIGQLADGRIHVFYQTVHPDTGDIEQREILAPWRANNPDGSLNPTGEPLVEQFRITTLSNDDVVEFIQEGYSVFGRDIEVLDIGDLDSRSNDYVSVIDGGPDDDILIGTPSRDLIDGFSGSDTMFGLAGDDRLWGHGSAGSEAASTNDLDIFFGGRGNDDMIGGPGINDMYAWTQLPLPAGDTQYGVFVDALEAELGPVFDDNGDLDGDGFLDADGVSDPRILEDTGLDRILGGRNADRIYLGTGLAFAFGNGGNDQMFRADGSLFETLDGGLDVDAWKQLAIESGKVWYVPGTEADDEISVDFVNEPGLLSDHHLITRLTTVDDVSSFSAQVRLDFGPLDGTGEPLFDGADVLADLELLFSQAEIPADPVNNPDPDAPTGIPTQVIGGAEGAVLEGLLPSEGDIDAILIDALGGNDRISVGPTTQLTVWIDAGDGNDRVLVQGGEIILSDLADLQFARNDNADTAYFISDTPFDAPPDNQTVLSQNAVLSGFTMDSPDDVDFFRFTLLGVPEETARIALESASDLDGLELALYAARPEEIDDHSTRLTALDVGSYDSLPIITEASIDTGEEDWFRITLDRTGVVGDIIVLRADAGVTLTLVDAFDAEIASATADADGVARISLNGLAGADYFVRVSGVAAPTLYELFFLSGAPAAFQSGVLQLGVDRTDLADPFNTVQNAFPLPDVTSISRATGLTIHDPTDVDVFEFTLNRKGVGGDRVNLLKTALDDQLTIKLMNAAGITLVASEETAPLVLSLSLEGLAAGTYYIEVATQVAPARYDLIFQVPALAQIENALSNLPNGTVDGAFDLGAHSNFPEVTGTSVGLDNSEWYEFRLLREGGPTDVVEVDAEANTTVRLWAYDQDGILQELDSQVATAVTDAVIDLNGVAAGLYYLEVTSMGANVAYAVTPGDRITERTIIESTTAGGELVRTHIRTIRTYSSNALDLSGKQTTFLDAGGLEAGKEYFLRVTTPNRIPTEYDLLFELFEFDGETAPLALNFAAESDSTRRDVIVGGPGHDALQGGPGPDWIFGMAGNDTISGGFDRAEEDLLMGGEGDDSFQLQPDQLPFIKGTTETLFPTLSDRIDGGPGADRMYFEGGDVDDLGRPIPDWVSIRWDRNLGRWEFTAVPWDLANQTFAVEREVVLAARQAPLNGFSGEVTFELLVPDPAQPDRGFVTITKDIVDAENITQIGEALQDALVDEFGLDENGNPVVTVAFPEGFLRFGIKGQGLVMRAAANDLIVTELGFETLTDGSAIYLQHYAFYQTISVEKTVINTRGGDDIVRADPEYFFPNVASEWGIKAGNFEERGVIGGLEIFGGEGNDRLFGGVQDDRIFGQGGSDVIFGSLGNDLLDGGPGRDLILGNTSLEPDPFEFVSRGGELDRNDIVRLAAELPAIRSGTTIEGLNVDLDDNGDWYLITAADAKKFFGDTTGALLTKDMISVIEVVETEGGMVPTGENLRAFLFAAENVGEPGGPLEIIPRERFSGVPEFYLLHVTTELEPSVANSGRSVKLDGADDRVVVNADPQLDILRRLTLEFWFKPDAVLDDGLGGLDFGTKTWMPIIYKGATVSPTSTNRTYTAWLNEAGYIHFTSAADGVQVTLNTTSGLIQAGEWSHFTGIVDRDQGQMRVYLNGELVNSSVSISTSSATSNPGSPLYVGATPETSAGYNTFLGKIDEVRIWNIVRTDSQIRKSYNRTVEADAAGLVLYTRFEEPEGLFFDNTADLSQNGIADLQGNLEIDPDAIPTTLQLGTDNRVNDAEAHDPTGRELILPFGPGLYQVKFGGTLGDTLQVGGDEAGQTFPAVDLSGQPIVILLGDIDGDTFADAVVSSRDNVPDGAGGFRHFARIAFGTADVTGTYTFFLNSDDGSRLFIDSTEVIDNGGTHAMREVAGSVHLQAGFHNIRLEYFENLSVAGVQLLWDPVGTVGKEIVPTDVLFRDARDVINVETDRDVVIEDLSAQPEAQGAGDITPLIGNGIFAELFDLAGFETNETVVFDGVDDRVTIPHIDAISGFATITLEVRFRIDKFTNTIMPLFQKGDGTIFGRSYAVFIVEDGSLLFQTVDEKGAFTNLSIPDGSLSEGEWYELAVVMDRPKNGLTLYLNGKPTFGDVAAVPGIVHDKPLLLGDSLESFGTMSNFMGAIEELVIWETARDADQIDADFGSPVDPADPDLVGYYQFAEESGKEVRDQSGSANNGFLGDGGSPATEPARLALLKQAPDFDTLTPEQVELAPSVALFDLSSLFDVSKLGEFYGVRWTGRLHVETGGDIGFQLFHDDRARLFIKDALVVDHWSLDQFSDSEPGSINLTAGVYDVRVEYLGNGQPGSHFLFWDPENDAAFTLVPEENLVRLDATFEDPTADGIDDFIIEDESGVRVVHGRAAEDWSDLQATDIDRFTVGGFNFAAGVGDVNNDGRDDAAILRFNTLTLFSGGALPGDLVPFATVTNVPFGRIASAGDLDGDAINDLLLDGNHILFGGSLPASDTLENLVSAELALALPEGAFRAIGDFDGPDAEGAGFADLGAAVMIETDKLNEAGTTEHQILQVYLGRPRDEWFADFADPAAVAPDLILEPGRASFTDPGEQTPESIYFGSLGSREGTDGEIRSLLGVSGPAGDALRVCDGIHLTEAATSDSGAGLALPEDLYAFELATAFAPGVLLTPPPGVDLANDADPNLRDAFAVLGTEEEEGLSGGVAMADFNGDSFNDFLIYGTKGSYVLLGPVELSDIEDAALYADIIISPDVGRPAARMGDITGDGLDDLVFLKPTTLGNFELIIVAGGNGAGIELPRLLDYAWVTQTLGIPNQERVQVRPGLALSEVGVTGFDDPSATLSVLNWNDDGFADVALVRSQAKIFDVQGFIFSGQGLWNGTGNLEFDPDDGNDAISIIASDTTDRAIAARAVLGIAEGEPVPTYAVSPNQRMAVAGDVNGDGLDDLIFIDPGFIDFDDPALPNIGRGYLLLATDPTELVPRVVFLDYVSDAEYRSALIVQDFSFGGSLAVLGDMNFDGYDEFAFGSTQEGRRAFNTDPTREGGLFIFFGQPSFENRIVTGESADVLVTRALPADLPQDNIFNGALTATAGDFDGDHNVDLAVGETRRLVTSVGSGQILDLDDSGAVYVFFNPIDGTDRLALTDADAVLTGELEFDALGVLPETPAFDLDLDGLDDLVMGASMADVIVADVIPAGGKIYFVYGSSSRASLPSTAVELGNKSITGLGFFLVDEGPGLRPTVFKDAPGEDNPKFVLVNGDNAWFTFTTLGDGQPGNSIRLVPGAIDGFLSPLDPDTSQLNVEVAAALGNLLRSRGLLDGSVGGPSEAWNSPTSAA